MGQNNLFSSYKNAANALVPAQVGKQSEVWMASKHGGRYLPTYGGLSGFAAVTGVTTTVGLATTYTGLCLSNPSGSTVNLVIQEVTANFIIADTAITLIGLIGGYAAGGITAHTTPGTVLNNKLGVAVTAFQGLVDTACTLVGTPAWLRFLTAMPTATTATGSQITYNAEGSIILPPGAYMAIGTNVASGTSGLSASIAWEEVVI